MLLLSKDLQNFGEKKSVFSLFYPDLSNSPYYGQITQWARLGQNSTQLFSLLKYRKFILKPYFISCLRVNTSKKYFFATTIFKELE